MATSFTRTEKAEAVLELTRPKNMVISFVGVFAGMLLVSETASVNHYVMLAAASAMLVLAGGNALNDYFDVEADKINRPARPIPSGRITKKRVKWLAALLFLAGLAAAYPINGYCLAMAAFNSLVLMAYARYSKKALLFSNIAIGYLTASVFVYGALTVYGSADYNQGNVGLLGVLVASSFLMTFSREVIKDIEDVKGDLKTGADTLPLRIGKEKSKSLAIAAGAAAVAVSFMPFVGGAAGFNKAAYALFIMPANLIFISSYFREPGRNQRLLVVGMTISLIAFLAGRLA